MIRRGCVNGTAHDPGRRLPARTSRFEWLSDELLDRLVTQARELQVRADDWIIREGEQAESTAHRDQWPPGGL